MAAVVVGVLAGPLATPLQAQDYPTRPVMVIVPQPPGGGTDIITRIFADQLTKQLGQTIISAGDAVRYDMSDLAPSAFGGTDGKGEWKVLQDFMRDPGDVKAAQTALEDEAEKAWK